MSDNFLRAVQVLALVVGGVWVFVQFIWYQRDEIKLKDRELAASIQIKSLEVRLNELQKLRNEHEVAQLTTYRSSVKTSLKAEMLKSGKVGGAQFNANYSVNIANTSDETFEVSLWVLDFYIGTPKEFDKVGRSVGPIGFPADRWDPGSASKGAVNWQGVGSSGAILPAAIGKIQKPWDYITSEVNLVRGGGLVGVLKPGQDFRYKEDYLVKAPKGAYLCFVLSFCLERCAKSDDRWNMRDYVKLPESSTEKVDSAAADAPRRSRPEAGSDSIAQGSVP
jgi:hypothetical protein